MRSRAAERVWEPRESLVHHGRPMELPDIDELGTILSIWAHPDDETYLAGGLMASAAANGQRVVCVAASAGERGTSDPEGWPPARLRAVRRLEAAAAMAVLGVGEHHVLGLPDGGLASHERAGRQMVGRLFDEVRPDTVVTFGADGMTFHPDHQAVHRWVRDTWEEWGRSARLLEAAWTIDQLTRFGAALQASGAFMADLCPVGVPAEWLGLQVALSGSELDRKLVALRAMATQTAPLIAAVGEDVFAAQVAVESFVDASGVGARHSRASGMVVG